MAVQKFIPLTAFKHGVINASLLLCITAFLSSATLTATAQSDANSTLPFLSAGAESHSKTQFNLETTKFMTASIILVFIISFLVVFIYNHIFIFIYNYFSERRASTSAGGLRLNVGGLPKTSFRGLDSAILETFPTFVYSEIKLLRIDKGSMECAVCLNDFEDDEILRLIPNCNHVFHHDCINTWLNMKTTCPVCRADLLPKPEEITEITDITSSIQNFDVDVVLDQSVQTRIDNIGSEIVIPMFRDSRFTLSETLDLNLGDLNERTELSRSKSTESRFTNLGLSRSHSTGHSLVRPDESWDRFTLRLSGDVHGCVMLPREWSSKRGYKTSE